MRDLLLLAIPYGQEIETAGRTGSYPTPAQPQRVSSATFFGDGAHGESAGALMEWARILAYITGTVDQELLLRNEYLVAENRILKAQLKGRLRLSDGERAKLGEIGHRLGRQALGEVARAALPDTILTWYRRLVACKFDGSRARRARGRPPIDRDVEELIVRVAEENRSWGYDRIVGALANLGHEVSDQTVGNVLRRHGVPPAPERKHTTTWAAFIRAHLAVLAGTDFFTVEVFTLRGLVTYYVLFFIHLESRKVDIAGITVHPNEQWMQQMARNVTMEGCGALRDCRYLLHDRDTKYTASFRAIIESGHVKTLPLPARSPNLNAYAERWVRSVKEECLSKIILFGERSLRRAMSEYVAHYHAERNHQGKSNALLFHQVTETRREEPVQCRERLGGLLRYYHQDAGEFAGKSRPMAMRLRLGRSYAEANALLMTRIAGELASRLP
jgi:putative transposase